MSAGAAQIFSGAVNVSPGAVTCALPFGLRVVAYASTGNNIVMALNGAEWQVFQEIAVDVGEITCVQWCPDCINLAACGHGRVVIFEAVRVTDADTQLCPYKWEASTVLHTSGNIMALAWLRQQGEHVLVCAGDEVATWRTAPPPSHADDPFADAEVDDSEREKESVKWSRRQTVCFTVGEEWRTWCTQVPVPVCYVASCRDGETFATCGQFQTDVQVWFRSGAEYQCQRLSHPDQVTQVSWSRGVRRKALLTCCADGLLRVWLCLRMDKAVSWFAAATWPQDSSAAGCTATWLASPSYPQPFDDLGQIAQPDSVFGAVPSLSSGREWIVQQSGSKFILWAIEGLGEQATASSLRVSGPYNLLHSPATVSPDGLQALHVQLVESVALKANDDEELPIIGCLVGHKKNGRLHCWEVSLITAHDAPVMADLHVTSGACGTAGLPTVEQMLLSPDGSRAVAISSRRLILWDVADSMIQFTAPHNNMLSWCCEISTDELLSVSWLPQSTIFVVATQVGWGLYESHGALSQISAIDTNASSEVPCVSICAFAGTVGQWFVIGLTQPHDDNTQLLVAWSISRSVDDTFAIKKLCSEEISESVGAIMCGGPASSELGVTGKLLQIVKSDKIDATSGPMTVFVGNQTGNVVVYALTRGSEDEEESEESIIERAVAHFPEPKRIALKSSLLKMPAGAREKAVEKFMAMAPSSTVKIAVAATDQDLEYRLEVVRSLPQLAGAVTHIAAFDANHFAVVTSLQGTSTVHWWNAEPASWPDFNLSFQLRREDEEVLAISWNTAQSGGLSLAMALADRVEILHREKVMAWTSTGEEWKLVESINEVLQPVVSVMWMEGHGLVIASKYHVSVHIVLPMTSQDNLVKPDYHPDMLEVLLFAGDDAREMLGKIVRNVLRSAPEEWEAQKWRPPRTTIQELLASTSRQENLPKDCTDALFSMTALTERGAADFQERNAARQLVGKLREKAQLVGISQDQRAHLQVILDVHSQDILGSLDDNAKRFLIRVSFMRQMKLLSSRGQLKKSSEVRSLQPSDQVWAFHSETQEAMLQEAFPADTVIEEFVAAGAPLWTRNPRELERAVSKVASAQFKKNRDPDEVLLLYIAMKKTPMAIALYKSVQNQKVVQFLANNFSEQRWSTAAKKNGFNLMKKGKFLMAAAFLLLGDDLDMAITVLVKNAQNPMMALLVIRLFAGDRSDHYSTTLQDHVLSPCLKSGDYFTACIVYWMQEDYQNSLAVLCQPLSQSRGTGDRKQGESDTWLDQSSPAAWEIIKYISNRPVLKRAGLSNERYTDMIRVAVGAALDHSRKGQPLLGLQLLDSLVKWERFYMIARPEVNIHFTILIMQTMAVAALQRVMSAAASESSSGNFSHPGNHQQIDCPMLEPTNVLAAHFDLQAGTLLDSLCFASQTRLQFGLHREMATSQLNKPSPELQWQIIRSHIYATTAPLTQPFCAVVGYLSRLNSLHAIVSEALRADGALVPKVLVGAASLVGRFATAWQAQHYTELLAQFFPEQVSSNTHLTVITPSARKMNTGYILLLMLARLGFAVDERLGLRSFTEANMPPTGAILSEQLRRRVWCWFVAVKSLLRADVEPVQNTSSPCLESQNAFPVIPEVPDQARAAVSLWEALLNEERSSQRVSMELGAASILAKKICPDVSVGSGSIQAQELYVSTKDLPFRGMAVCSVEPSTIAVASAKAIHEVNIRGTLRRCSGSGVRPQVKLGVCMLVRERKAGSIGPHPTKPMYASGAVEGGRVEIWKFGVQQGPIATESIHDTTQRITRVRFNALGTKLGATDTSGTLSIFTADTDRGLMGRLTQIPCHSRSAADFDFLNAGSVVATFGNSSDRQNLSIFDTLLKGTRMRVHSENCHDGGISVAHFSSRQLRIYTGSEKGELGVFDLRMMQMVETFQAHDSTINSISLSRDHKQVFTGSKAGSLKIWDATALGDSIFELKDAHVRHTGALGLFARDATMGVQELYQSDFRGVTISCGADGRICLIDLN